MSLRRGFLIAMLVALALCAGMGVLIVFTGSDDLTGRLLGTTINTAVASGLLLGLSFLAVWPKLRLGALTGMGVILFGWLVMLGILWTERWMGGSHVQESLAATFGFSLLMGLPSAALLCFVSFNWARFAIRFFVAGPCSHS